MPVIEVIRSEPVPPILRVEVVFWVGEIEEMLREERRFHWKDDQGHMHPGLPGLTANFFKKLAEALRVP